ncbi:MAG: histidine kinase [Alphaproteobacteria bacterium]|nr:histidine kinase [Alphaproteobacteria bacterium]
MSTQPPAWRSAIGPSVLGIGALALLQALAAMARPPGGPSLQAALDALWQSAPYYPPWVVLCVVAFGVLAEGGSRLGDRRFVAGGFAVAFVTFFLPYVVYEVAVAEAQAGRPWTGALQVLRHARPLTFFADFVLFVGVYALLHGAALARGELAREREARRMAAEVLELRLQVERQRLQALQAQLEPHFLFNALNAVSGLVRTGASDEALAAINQLAGLLRYATTASRTEWVGLDEELAFVDDYLALQRLRYGERLRVTVRTSGDPTEIRCPPLVLQPLVENALRHDLDVHAGEGHLALAVDVDEDRAVVRVENALRAGRPPNPGLGLGLSSLSERLAMRFPGAASLDAGARGELFVAELTLPRSDDGR